VTAPKVSQQQTSNLQYDLKDLADPQACAEYVGNIAANLLKQEL